MKIRLVALLFASLTAAAVGKSLAPGDCCCSLPDCASEYELCGGCPSGRAAAAPVNVCATGSMCYDPEVHPSDVEGTSRTAESKLGSGECCCASDDCKGEIPLCGIDCPIKKATADEGCSTGYSCTPAPGTVKKSGKDEL